MGFLVKRGDDEEDDNDFEFSEGYIAKHRRKCAAVAAAPVVEARQPQVYKGKRFVCDCGAEIAKTNKSRHKRKACPNGDARP